MDLTPDNLKELRDQLKKTRGSIVRVACEAECSSEWVRRVLKGDYKDDKVILCAAKVLNNQKQKAIEVQQAVNSSLSI